MQRRILIIAVSVVCVAGLATASAASKHPGHHVRHVHHPVAAVAPGPSFAPARMYEARPGVWISTYGCITDEGYGRWLPCDIGKR